MPTRALVDTGPLVAWLDADDEHHTAVNRFMAGFQGQLLSTWPVLTETCRLVPDHLAANFLRWVGADGLTVVDLPTEAITGLADRMDKYADLPMDLADASLIWLAETRGVLDILTLDKRDFGVYCTERGKALRNLLDLPLPQPPGPRHLCDQASAEVGFGLVQPAPRPIGDAGDHAR